LIELLKGVRVVESAVLLNGGVLGSLLGALGADVIKVEAPGRGDYLRDIQGTIVPRHSPIHMQYNAHKRSVVLDLRNEMALDVFWRLHATCDVFIDGGVPGALNRLGIGYAEQVKRKGDIIYCEHTAFGATGPYSNIPMHGFGMNAMAADLVVEKRDDGLLYPTQTRRPIPPRGPEATQIGALWAAYFVASALVRRASVAEPQMIDVSATDAVVISTGAANVMELNLDRVTDHTENPGFTEEGALTGAKYQFYETGDDKKVMFAAAEPRFWRRFCEGVDRPDLLGRGDPDSEMDWGRDPDLRIEVQQIFRRRSLSEWMEFAAERGIPVSPAYTDLRDVKADPQMAGRNTFYDAEHPVAGPFTYLGVPAVMADQPFEVRRPAPLLGQHTDEVLREIGIPGRDIDQLLKS
jgi:crotonobetainyl-CoA:carnitine CoA-transferase CaiB-like acyl-CoA transferase